MTTASLWGALDSAGFQTMRLLLSLLWQSSIVLVAAGGLAWLLRRRQASVRHLVWVTALVAAPVLPLAAWLGASVGVPQAKISVMPAYTVEPAAMPAVPAVEQAPGVEPIPRKETSSSAPPPAPREPRFALSDYPWALALMTYGGGAVLCLFLVLLGRYRISRWRAGGRVVTDERVLGAFGEAGRRLGLNRRPLIVAAAEVQTPLTIGALRPAVLLPEEFEAGLSAGDLRAIALHECAHIRRRDPLVLELASLLRALFFLHPLVWLACRQVSLLAEQAADDAVLDVTGQPIAYAKMLARLAEELRRRSLTTELAAGIVLSKSAFLRRVEAILSDRRDSLRRLSRRALVLTILAALLSLALAAALPLGEKQPSAAGLRRQPGENRALTVGDICKAIEAQIAKMKDIEVHYEVAFGIAQATATGELEFVPGWDSAWNVDGSGGVEGFTEGRFGSFNCVWKQRGPKVFFSQDQRQYDARTTGSGVVQPHVFESHGAAAWNGTEGRTLTTDPDHGYPVAFMTAEPRPSLQGATGLLPSQFAHRTWDVHGQILLVEMLKKYETKIVSLGEVVGESTCVQLLVVTQLGLKHKYWLDMDRGVHIVRYEERDARDKPVWGICEVGLEEVAPNVWYPVRALGWSHSPDGLDAKQYRATMVKVNQQLPDSAFEIEFPAGTNVMDERTRRRYIVPGPSEPAKPEPPAAAARGGPELPTASGPTVSTPLTADQQVLRDKLAKHVTFSFADAPLETVADFLQQATDINVVVDQRVLTAAGPGGKRVTLTVTNVALQDALDIMLTMLDLEWTVRDGALHISPPSNKPESRVAPAGALREKEATSPGATSGAKIASANAAGDEEATQSATAGTSAARPLGEKAATPASEANAAQGGGVLRYRHGLLPVLQQEVGYLGGRELTPATEKPEVKAEPTYAGTPVYFLIELGEKGGPPYVTAYDPKGGGGIGAVYFDLDHDGDLAEEEPTLPQPWGEADNFGPIAVKLDRDGFVGLYHCWVELRHYGGSTGDRWSLRPGCYNVGEITFEGKTYKAAAVDSRTDGVFNDICWANMSQGDLLLVDWNGNGTFDWLQQFSPTPNEYVMVGERYWRDGKWYRPSFSADGTEVSFTPANLELAPLITGHEKFWMQITSQSNTGSVQIESTGGRVDLPVDSYSLYLCWVEAKDAQGNTWRAEAQTGGPYPKFEVKAGEENRYAFGPPLSVSLKASPEGSYQPGQTIRLQATIAGAEGKTYVLSRNGGALTASSPSADGSGTGDGEPMVVPKVVLKDESGKEIGSFQMQRGYPGGSGSWTVPDNAKGKVTATVSIDAGPFAWKAEDLVLEVK